MQSECATQPCLLSIVPSKGMIVSGIDTLVAASLLQTRHLFIRLSPPVGAISFG